MNKRSQEWLRHSYPVNSLQKQHEQLTTRHELLLASHAQLLAGEGSAQQVLDAALTAYAEKPTTKAADAVSVAKDALIESRKRSYAAVESTRATGVKLAEVEGEIRAQAVATHEKQLIKRRGELTEELQTLRCSLMNDLPRFLALRDVLDELWVTAIAPQFFYVINCKDKAITQTNNLKRELSHDPS